MNHSAKIVLGLYLTAVIMPAISHAQLQPLYIDPYYLEKYVTEPVVTDPIKEPLVIDNYIIDPADPPIDPYANDPNQPLVTPTPTQDPIVTPVDPIVTDPINDPTISDPAYDPAQDPYPPYEPTEPTPTDPYEDPNPPTEPTEPTDPIETPDPTDTATNDPTDTTTNQYNPDDGTNSSSLSIRPIVPILEYQPREPIEDEDPLECPEAPVYDPSTITPYCPAPSEIISEAQPYIVYSQMVFSILAILGAFIGGLIWLIGTALMQKNQLAHESKRSERLERQASTNRIAQELESSWPKISSSISEIVDTLETGATPSSTQIQQLRKNSTALDLFASQETINAKNNLLSDLNKKSSPEKITTSLSTLQQKIKNDLGLS